MENTIKIIVSGTKGGAQTLCTNFDKAEHDVIAPRTASDYRKYFIVEIPGTKIWGITFTERYKVYIAYYSLFEPGGTRTGGYVAINVYIPHEKVCADPFALVNKLLNRYLERYVDSITKQMSPKNVVIDDFKDLLDGELLTTSVRVHRYVSNSGTSGLHTVNTESEIAEIFKDPYRPELKNWEKVFFIEKRFYENPEINRSFKNIPLINLSKIHELEKGLRLRSKYEIKSLKINGIPVTGSEMKKDNTGYYYEGLFAGDKYQATLSRLYYHELRLQGEVSSMSQQKDIQLENLYNQSSWEPIQVSIAIETSPAKPPYFLLRIGNKEFKGKESIKVDEVLVDDPFTLEAIENLSDNKGQVLHQGSSIENKKISILELNQIELTLEGTHSFEKTKVLVNNDEYNLVSNKKLVVYYKGTSEPKIKLLESNYKSDKVKSGRYVVKYNQQGSTYTGSNYKPTNSPKNKPADETRLDEQLNRQILKLNNDLDGMKKKHKKAVKFFLIASTVLFFIGLAGGLFLGNKIFNKNKSKTEDSNQKSSTDSNAISPYPGAQGINWEDSIYRLNEELYKLRNENKGLIDENEKLKKPAPATANPATNNPRTHGSSQPAPATRVTNGNNADDISSLNLEQLVRKYYASGTSGNTKTEIAKKIQKDRGLKDLQAAYTLIEDQKLALRIR